MFRASLIVPLVLLLAPNLAEASNSDDVVAGSDVALTGGAVVANVHTGGAMWFNPAGVARLDSRSVDLTGSVLSYTTASAPGALSIQSGEQSAGEFSAVQAIPRAITFVISPRPALRWGMGFFFSRSTSRFIQDTVATATDSSEPSEFFASADETQSLYHLSGTVAWKHSEKFLLGGGMDLVVASKRASEIISGGYDGGAEGSFSRNLNQAMSGGGLQLKLGIQWAPVKRFRLGWMAATPSYLVYIDDETTVTQTSSPPGQPSVFDGNQIDELGGTWSGIERGLTRIGGAFLDHWGWVEADVIVRFPLKTPNLGINWKTTADVQVGGVFRITERLKLGAGFFTDFAPERRLESFAETKVNFYGFTLGIDFANKEAPPERGEDGFYLAFAVVLRYAHGSGEMLGLQFASAFPETTNRPGQLNAVGLKINEYGINLAIKAAF